MVEMLGVLAIIGVLSIGGLYTYRQAIDIYNNNRVINFLSMVRLTAMQLCSKDNCLLNGTGEDNYKKNAKLICGFVENPPEFCQFNTNCLTYISFFKKKVAWISYASYDIVSMQFYSLTKEQCIAFSNPKLVDGFSLSARGKTVYSVNGEFSKEDKQKVIDYCTNEVATQGKNTVIFWFQK